MSELRFIGTTAARAPRTRRIEPLCAIAEEKRKMMVAKMSSDTPLPAALSAARPLGFGTEIVALDDWYAYPFNYNGAATPPLREISDVSGTYLKVESVEHFLTYHFRDQFIEHQHANVETIDHPLVVLAVSTSNAGHAMSEIMSFINFARELPADIRIAVSYSFVDKLPFISKFIENFFDTDRIIVLRRNTIYHLRKAWIRRENHFNASYNWMDLEYTSAGNVLCFENLAERIKFDDDPDLIHTLVRRIYEECHDRYTLHERVMMLKTADSQNLTTPGRALVLDNRYKEKIENAGFHLAAVDQFRDIEEYICTLYHAQQVVLSYGSTTCTNRFFVNPDCDVIVIANQAYQFEYEYPVSTGAHWHVRHSHLLPVRRQRVIIGHNNAFSEDDVNNLLQLADG